MPSVYYIGGFGEFGEKIGYMASGINIYSDLLISRIRILDISYSE